MKPANSAFPYQVELFSRSLGLMNFPEEARITPIPVDEDLSSLSAILMDEDYYRFTIEHSLQEDGVHIANIESLICLKSKAFLDLSQRKLKVKVLIASILQSIRKMSFVLQQCLHQVIMSFIWVMTWGNSMMDGVCKFGTISDAIIML